LEKIAMKSFSFALAATIVGVLASPAGALPTTQGTPMFSQGTPMFSPKPLVQQIGHCKYGWHMVCSKWEYKKCVSHYCKRD
jgi:hypothetical protein